MAFSWLVNGGNPDYLLSGIIIQVAKDLLNNEHVVFLAIIGVSIVYELFHRTLMDLVHYQ